MQTPKLILINLLVFTVLVGVADKACQLMFKHSGPLVYLSSDHPQISESLSPYEVRIDFSNEPRYFKASAINPSAPLPNRESSGQLYDYNGTMGPTPDSAFEEREWVSTEPNLEIFKIQIFTDPLGRRIGADHKIKKSIAREHAIGIGDSFMWGEGVDYENAIIAQFEGQSPARVGYILAFHGYGLGDLISRIDNAKALENIQPKRGLALFSLVGDNLFRFANITSIVGDWGHSIQTLNEIRPGEFRASGQYKKVFPFTQTLQRLFFLSHFRKLFSLEWPSITQGTADQMARAIAYIRKRYHQETDPRNKFLVVMLPNNWTQSFREMTRRALTDNELQFVDLTSVNVAPFVPSETAIQFNGHFSASTNQLIGRLLKNQVFNP